MIRLHFMLYSELRAALKLLAKHNINIYYSNQRSIFIQVKTLEVLKYGEL